jgi:hypothetical protein
MTKKEVLLKSIAFVKAWLHSWTSEVKLVKQNKPGSERETLCFHLCTESKPNTNYVA